MLDVVPTSKRDTTCFVFWSLWRRIWHTLALHNDRTYSLPSCAIIGWLAPKALLVPCRNITKIPKQLLLHIFVLFTDSFKYIHFTFIYPCITDIFPNYTEQDATFLDLFISRDAVHFSGGSSAHHKEHKTVHTASGIVNQYCCRRGWDRTKLIHASS